MNIQLSDCPAVLQKAVEGKEKQYAKSFGDYQIISVTRMETTPYKDKSIISTYYRVILMTANFFDIMDYSESEGDSYNLGIMSSSLTIGSVQEIIDRAPELVGFEGLASVSEKIKAVG